MRPAKSGRKMRPAHRMAEVSHVSDLVPDPENRRKHNARNLGMVSDALKQVGAARSIVIDENNVILAGNGVTEAAPGAGITKVRVVEAKGDEIIAVRRSGLTAEQKRALAIYDNRAGELAEWNPEQLQADHAAGLTLEPWFTDSELSALLPNDVKGGLTDPDDIPPERPTEIVRGDLFELGEHRLICGDSTDAMVVARVLASVKPHLMVTDPPYGVNYDPTWRVDAPSLTSNRRGGTAEGKISNDDRDDWADAWELFTGDVAYVWHSALHAVSVAQSLEKCDFQLRAQIIWKKAHHPMGRGHYHWRHEPCWYAVKKGGTGHWAGDRKQNTIWEVLHQKSDTGHGSQKPVECMRRPIENNSSPGQAVYDPFIGSGTTIIAAEQVGRVCYSIELNPSYVQVAIDRWEAFTGKRAVKVGEAIRA